MELTSLLTKDTLKMKIFTGSEILTALAFIVSATVQSFNFHKTALWYKKKENAYILYMIVDSLDVW